MYQIRRTHLLALASGVCVLAACGDGPADPPPEDELPDPVVFVSVSIGGFHACGVTESSTISCWGENNMGQLGTSNTTGSEIPVPVNSTEQWAAVSAGGQHTCALTTTNELHCWGSDAAGQLGRGTFGNFHSSPLPVTGGLSFRSVSASSAHTCAVTTTGEAYCWGVTDNGRLGIGSGTALNFEPAPVMVDGGHTFTRLVTGSSHGCGLVSSESYCWGRGSEGQLGHARLSGSETPVLTTGGHVWQALAAGSGDHTCGIALDGDAYCWGDNAFGQAGAANGGTFSQPNLVAGGMTFSASAGLQDESLATGPQHTCALTSGGAAYCWGGNQTGQLGNGNENNSDAPVAVAGGLSFESITAGGTVLNSVSCGLTNDRIVYCWGSNQAGQLGQFDLIASSTTPVRVFGQAAVSTP